MHFISWQDNTKQLCTKTLILKLLHQSMCLHLSINPLAAEYLFLIPSRDTEIISYKPSPGMDFFQCLLFGTDFFLWYSCFPGWEMKLLPYLQYRVSVSTLILKRGTRIFSFHSYVLYIVKINISFCLSKVGSPGADLSASHA